MLCAVVSMVTLPAVIFTLMKVDRTLPIMDGWSLCSMDSMIIDFDGMIMVERSWFYDYNAFIYFTVQMYKIT